MANYPLIIRVSPSYLDHCRKSYRSFAKKWRAKNQFNFITTKYILVKLCIPFSITHTNSGKGIQNFFLLFNKKLLY